MAARRYAASAVLFLALLFPSPAHAVWPHDPVLNLPIGTAALNQTLPVAVSDGAGGIIIAWQDFRTGLSDIYVQRVDASGSPMWTADGVGICTAVGNQAAPAIVSDGAGGAIVAWSDARTGGGSADIYAQRVNAAGVAQWTANGVAISTAANLQDRPAITTDGAGGAIIAWQDTRSAVTYDIYVRRVIAAGVPQWTADGVAICVAAGDQTSSVIVSDGLGGAIIAWQDSRGGTSNYDIYAQRVNSVGGPVGPTDGASVCSAAGNQTSPAIATDGANGAFIAWSDGRVATPDIYINRMTPAVSILFGASGIAVCTAVNTQSEVAITADGANGAILSWTDSRSGVNDIYAQRVGFGGAMQWTANGIAVTVAPSNQGTSAIISDGQGGALIVWQDSRPGNPDLYAQRVDASGTPLWAAFGAPVSTAAWDQFIPVMVPDGAGGAVIAWYDDRSFYTYDIYAQRIDGFGYLGAEPAITSVRDVKNDQGGKVKVSWNASWLDGARDPNLTTYSIYRSVPSSAALAALRHGEHLLRAQGYAWEFVADVAAAHVFSSYSYVAPTTGDSIAGSNPMTAFMVMARNGNSTYQWMSSPDSGYSVDNLGPMTPAPFNGNYAGGATRLHWDPNHEADLAGYRLYRGNSAGFVPGPGNLVSAQSDTGYSDAGAAGSYYKLSAIDTHGNESPFALLSPNGTTDVPHPPFGFALWLAGAVPNPAIGTAEIQFTLPHEDVARVQILDAAGRLVREVSSARLPAGPNSVRWDARRSDGTSAPAGLYFVRLETAGRTLTRRMALMR